MTSVPDADICEPDPSAVTVEKPGMPWLVSGENQAPLERVHSPKKGRRAVDQSLFLSLFLKRVQKKSQDILTLFFFST